MPRYQHDVFLSYTGTDASYAEELYYDLDDYGALVWFDKESMPENHGYDANGIRHELTKGMRESEALLILVSVRSMASKWVRYELDTALALEARHPERRIVTLLVGRGSERDVPEPVRGRRVFDLRHHFEQRYHLHRAAIFRDLLPWFDLGEYTSLFDA